MAVCGNVAVLTVNRNVTGTVAAWGTLLDGNLPEGVVPVATFRTHACLDNDGGSPLAMTVTPGGAANVTNRSGSSYSIPNNKQSMTGALAFLIE